MKYIVLKAVQLPTGTQVKLSDAQIARRGDQVAHVKGKLYECLRPAWFKAGELLDMDEPAKHVLESLQPQSSKPAAPEKVFVPPAASPAPAAEDSAEAAAPASGSALSAHGSPLTAP